MTAAHLIDRPGGEEPGAIGPSGARPERWVERRISIIWGLLFFNGLGYIGSSIVQMPKPVAQVFTMGALGVALVLAVCLNPRLRIRPNLVLGLASLLSVTAFMMSIRGQVGLGSGLRSIRLFGFLAVLWLLTPWWSRRDLLLVRCHLRAVVASSCVVIVGLIVAPGLALSGAGQGRLVGALWPIPAPQVAEYAAMAVGIALVMWLSGAMARGPALLVAGGGAAMLLASQTRTALIGLVAGLVAAGITSFAFQRRFRKAVVVVLCVLPFAVALLGPASYAWFTREQSSDQLAGLTGRKEVWAALVKEPRAELNQWFGLGLSDKSFNGLSIDNTWLAAYQDEGLVGVGIVAAIFLYVLITPPVRPPGPGRAVATFIAVYCLAASYTEVGIGDASNYLLAVVAAASLLTNQQPDETLPSTPV